MVKLAVADEDAEAAEVEEFLVDAFDAVDHAGDADPVVGPAPLRAGDRYAHLHRCVDVGEVPRLDSAVGPPCAHEDAEVFCHLLLDIEAYARLGVIMVAHQGDVGGLPRQQGQRVRVLEEARAADGEEARHLDLAGLAPQIVAFLDLGDIFKLLEGGIETVGERAVAASGRRRQVEHAGAQRPAPGVPLRGCAVSIAPGVARIVEGAGVDERPVQEVASGAVREFVGVEDVDDGELDRP